jgi:hypothetical protein
VKRFHSLSLSLTLSHTVTAQCTHMLCTAHRKHGMQCTHNVPNTAASWLLRHRFKRSSQVSSMQHSVQQVDRDAACNSCQHTSTVHAACRRPAAITYICFHSRSSTSGTKYPLLSTTITLPDSLSLGSTSITCTCGDAYAHQSWHASRCTFHQSRCSSTDDNNLPATRHSCCCSFGGDRTHSHTIKKHLELSRFLTETQNVR